jgi:hypothetical protein
MQDLNDEYFCLLMGHPVRDVTKHRGTENTESDF